MKRKIGDHKDILEAMINVMEFTKDMTMSSLKIPRQLSEP